MKWLQKWEAAGANQNISFNYLTSNILEDSDTTAQNLCLLN